MAGFFGAASSSPTGDGGGAAFGLSSSSSSRAPELDDFSSLLASSLSGAESGSADLPFDFVAGVLCFFAGFFFFASADSDTKRTISATTNASARATRFLRAKPAANSVRRGNAHTHTSLPAESVKLIVLRANVFTMRPPHGRHADEPKRKRESI